MSGGVTVGSFNSGLQVRSDLSLVFVNTVLLVDKLYFSYRIYHLYLFYARMPEFSGCNKEHIACKTQSIASYKNCHRDIKYSIGNIVNNIIILYGIGWVLDLLGGSFHKV